MPALTPAFDAKHPPSADILNQCVHCGFCLSTCPTYVLTGKETESPRGRIYSMQLAAEGRDGMSPQWVSHFDSCLGCLACMTACPSGVDYGQLIEATRGQIARGYRRPVLDWWHRRALLETLTRPDRLRWLKWPALVYQRSGLQAIVRRTGVLRLLPARLGVMERLMPRVAPREASGSAAEAPAAGASRGRVGLLLGCVQREFLSHVNAATARVIAAEGFEVVAPAAQPCCGALWMHAGEEARAAALARQLIDVFDRAGVNVIVTNAGGCGSHMASYARLLQDDPDYRDRAARFEAKCQDVTVWLAGIEARAIRHPVEARVAYHDSCHLQHGLGVRTAPRTVLAAIPGVEVVTVPEPGICCGSAGLYNLVEPATAETLGQRKAALIAPLGAAVVATGNPGCLLQLQAALDERGAATRVVHTIEVVDASIRGASLTS